MRTPLQNLFVLLLSLTLCLGTVIAQQATKQDTLLELMRRIDLLTIELEKRQHSTAIEPEYESRYGMGPAASKVYQLQNPGVSIAGYGEVVYNNFSNSRDDATPSNTLDKIDFLRHVTYFGFRFNDWLLFNSEIEFEHAKTGDGAPGEVAIEFGYLELALHPLINLRAGMMLVPVGIINLMHEPSTFHGALRPETERRIIPSTWRANGFGLLGETESGIGYKLYVMESLNAENFSSNGIRSGRQNGAKATAEDLALAGRLHYKGIAGLEFGGSFFVGNTGQAMIDSTTGNAVDARLFLFSVHTSFARRGLELRGLVAQSTISQAAELNSALRLADAQGVGKRQRGYYLTVAYDVMPLLIPASGHYLAPFLQYEKFNTQDEVAGGFTKNASLERKNLTLGITYKPYPNVAFKLDYINRDNQAGTALDQFNIAVNYLF